ncbi:hypothetical protein LINGRAHAP2_LOCUS33958 [Linum grandiflorum]
MDMSFVMARRTHWTDCCGVNSCRVSKSVWWHNGFFSGLNLVANDLELCSIIEEYDFLLRVQITVGICEERYCAEMTAEQPRQVTPSSEQGIELESTPVPPRKQWKTLQLSRLTVSTESRFPSMDERVNTYLRASSGQVSSFIGWKSSIVFLDKFKVSASFFFLLLSKVQPMQLSSVSSEPESSSQWHTYVNYTNVPYWCPLPTTIVSDSENF